MSTLQDLTRRARAVRLLVPEKQQIWRDLLSHMTQQQPQTLWGHLFSLHFARLSLTGPVCASVLLVVVIGMAQAEAALPGDALYPLKQVSEEMRGTFTFSTEDHARWEAIRAARRLQELEQLEASHRLNPTLREQVGTAFTSQLDK